MILPKDCSSVNGKKSHNFSGDLIIDTIIDKDHKGVILSINDRTRGMLWMKKLESKEAFKKAVATKELWADYRFIYKKLSTQTMEKNSPLINKLLMSLT